MIRRKGHCNEIYQFYNNTLPKWWKNGINNEMYYTGSRIDKDGHTMKLLWTKSFANILSIKGYNWEVQVVDYLMTKTSNCIQVVQELVNQLPFPDILAEWWQIYLQ